MSLPSATSDLASGRYRLIEILGQGGMATVYRGWDTRLLVYRAIKVIHADPADRTTAGARLEAEAKTLAQLRHPNIVTVHETGVDEGRVFLVMELLEGGSLADRIERDGPLAPGVACGMVELVLAALALAHANGVIHRDIKPHNVLLDAASVPRLADFGIARVEDGGGTRTGMVMGTLAYMAPEQRLDSKRVTARCDLYAVGATLYALISGREPFDLYAAGLDATLAAEFYHDLPTPVVDVIRKACAYRPEDRYQSAEVMLTAVRLARASLDPITKVPRATPERGGAGETLHPTAEDSAPARTSGSPDAERARPSVGWLAVLTVAAVTVVVSSLGWVDAPSALEEVRDAEGRGAVEPSAPVTGGWDARPSTDGPRVVERPASNALRLASGGVVTPILVVGCGDRPVAWIEVFAPLEPHAPDLGVRRTWVEWAIDGVGDEQGMEVDADRHRIQLTSPEQWILAMRTGRSLQVTFATARAPKQAATFDLAGFDQASRALLATCGR